MKNDVNRILAEALALQKAITDNEELQMLISDAASIIINAFGNEKKLLLCGNGGSAADAQHIAAELSGRFMKERRALDAEALHVNTSYLTAVANDYGYQAVYERLLSAKGKEGDVLIAISTSGNFQNIIAALKQAKKLNMKVIGMTGAGGGQLKTYCDVCITIPSNATPRIQEAHILIGHILCELIENKLFA